MNIVLVYIKKVYVLLKCYAFFLPFSSDLLPVCWAEEADDDTVDGGKIEADRTHHPSVFQLLVSPLSFHPLVGSLWFLFLDSAAAAEV